MTTSHTSRPRTASSTSSDTEQRSRFGCLSLSLIGLALALTFAALFGGPAEGAESRWEARVVAGTGYAAVFRDGLPRRPGMYRVVITEPGKADFYQGVRRVGRGTYMVVEPQRENVRIEVSPNARITVVGQ